MRWLCWGLGITLTGCTGGPDSSTWPLAPALSEGSAWQTLWVGRDTVIGPNDVVLTHLELQAGGGRARFVHVGTLPVNGTSTGEELWMDYDGAALARHATSSALEGASYALIGGSPDRARYAARLAGTWTFGEVSWPADAGPEQIAAQRATMEAWVLWSATNEARGPEALTFDAQGRALGATSTGGAALPYRCAPLIWSIADGETTRHAYEGVSQSIIEDDVAAPLLGDQPLVLTACADVVDNALVGQAITPWRLGEQSVGAPLEGNVDLSGASAVLPGARYLTPDRVPLAFHATPGGAEVWRDLGTELEIVRYDLSTDTWTRERAVTHPFGQRWVDAGWPLRDDDGALVLYGTVDGFPAVLREAGAGWEALMDGSERDDPSAALAGLWVQDGALFAALVRPYDHPPSEEMGLTSVGYVLDLVRWER